MASKQPKIGKVIGHLWTASCHYRYDPEKGRATALEQLQMKALSRGANELVNVRTELVINNRSPCWHGFEATGTAVVFDQR
jgi:uncharacterized protein YbjQ (UPF0145 family)